MARLSALRALAALALARCAAADALLSVNAAWFMDPSVQAYTPSGTGWFDPIATPIDLALRDLKTDWFKTIGVNPSVISSLPTGKWDGDVVVIFALAPPGAAPEESFTVVAAPPGAGAAACTAPTLTVTGADVRGLIYGIYHVSADFLGVDAFWWFNDATPVYEPGGVAVAPTYSYSSGAPAFDSRGAFNNDEDLSGYFASSPLGDAVYHTFFADRFCEALLRLRVNTFIPSTFAYIDESHYLVAARRGLRLGNHHVMPVGNNVAAWPKGVAYADRLNPEPFKAAWRALADYQQREQGREMVYSLGYRGVNDEPFWDEDSSCTTNECRGATITQAIANQSEIALSTPFVVRPKFVAYMWMELLQLLEAGVLLLPPGVACTWTDFPGAFLFSGGFDNVTAGHGMYAHISMMNGQAGQLTEFIPPARIFANVWQFWSRNATAYGMINLSDLKFVPLTAEAVYRYMWSPASFNASSACKRAFGVGEPVVRDAAGRRGHIGAWPLPRPGERGCSAADFGGVTPAEAQDAFILEFATRHYGAAAGATAAGLYGRYFNITYMATAVPGQATKADHYLGGQLRSLVSAFAAGGGALKSAADECASVAAANLPFVEDLFVNGVAPLAASLPQHTPASRFFNAHLYAQAGIHHSHLRAFAATAAAAYASLDGDSAAAAANLTVALQAMDDLLAVLRQSEGHGAWHGSTAADGWTWCWGSRQYLSFLLARLQGRVLPALPDNPYPDYEIMTYELTTPNDPTDSPSFPFATFNASIAFDAVPRFACAGDIPPAPPAASAASAAASCSSTWVGVTLTAPSNVGLFVANYSGPGQRMGTRTIRYTLDGSAPGPASAAYTAPFQLSANCTVRSRSFDDASGAPVGPESAATVVMA